MSPIEHYFENLLTMSSDIKGEPNKNALSKEVQEAVEICADYIKTTKNDLGVDAISRADVNQVIEDYMDEQYHVLSDRTRERAFGAKVVKARINELPTVTQQETRWIPVSERLPDTDDEVLCWYEYYHWSQEKVLPEYGFGSYFKETKTWFGEVAIGKDVRVIAWMPLPKPYSEVEE